MWIWLMILGVSALVVVTLCVNLVGNHADEMMEQLFDEDLDEF